MKLAVIADIHANLAALHAVVADLEAWHPDVVVVAGDIINRGPRPAECFEFVKEKETRAGWLLLGGNHEDYVISLAEELLDTRHPVSARRYATFQPVYWTSKKVMSNLNELKALSFQQVLTAPNGTEARVVHASMRGNRDGIYAGTSDQTLAEQIAPPVPLFCVGHTHRSLIRTLNSTLVVNVGSVGLPFDGDTRATYGRLQWQKNGWQAEIRRVNYDMQQAERDFFQTGFVDEGGPLTQVMLSELRSARSLLYVWSKHYEPLVMTGKLTVAQAVDDYLISLA